MQDPEREIRDIIQRLTTTKDIETQTAALHDYFTEDASYDHAMVQIPAGPGSRDRLQGCYRFYKAAVKNIKIDIKDVFYHKDKMVVDLVETLTPRFMPWRRFDMRLIVVLYLRQDSENKKYYIYRQEDIFQTHDLAKFIPLGGQALWLWKGFGAYCGSIMSYGTKALGIGHRTAETSSRVRKKDVAQKKHGDDGHNNNHSGKELETIKEEVIGNIIKVDDIDIAIKTVPITVQRRPFVDRGQPKKPGVPRAFTAPSQEFTHGAHLYHIQHQNQTVLQQHVDFFDANGDGVIWPWDTFIGFHMIGFNIALSILAMIIVHSGFSYPTCSTYLPDPFFRIWTSRIHKAIHGSDSDTYDSEGRYVPQKFEDLFSKYSVAPDRKTLHWTDLVVVHRGNRNVMDPFGWMAEAFELFALWWLLADDEGYVHKHEVRGVYDGSIFYERWEQRKPFEPWYWRWLTGNHIQGYSGSLKPGDHGERRGSVASAKTYSTAESEKNTSTSLSA